MLAQIISQPQAQIKPLDYCDGEFDAAIKLPPKQTHGDYWQGYLAYTLNTGNAPF